MTPSSVPQPRGRPVAAVRATQSRDADGRLVPPGTLALVQALINTAARDSGRDKLASALTARRWLKAHGLLAAETPFATVDADSVRRLREGLRGLLWLNAGAPADNELVADLNRVIAKLCIRVVFTARGAFELQTEAPGPESVICRVLQAVQRAQLDGTWRRLKACRRCGWAFYDASRNLSSVWCTAAICGNRAKGSAFRERRRHARLLASP